MEKWEEEFEKELRKILPQDYYAGKLTDIEKIKQFISDLLKEKDARIFELGEFNYKYEKEIASLKQQLKKALNWALDETEREMLRLIQ